MDQGRAEAAFGMKQAVTIRIDPESLANARKCAKQENRPLTNFIETVLKERIALAVPPIQKRSN
jgi:hypothetical protein